MGRKSVASKFNLLIILFVVISISLSSLTITLYLLHRYSKDVIEKDKLHMKGLASSVRGFIDHAFTLNYLLSINPEIIKGVVDAPEDWTRRISEYNKLYDTTAKLKNNSGLSLLVNIQKLYDFVELFFVQDALGDQTSRSFGPLGHRGQRWWFQKITADHNYKPFISKSYYSMTGDKPVASAFHPIYNNNRFIGVMGTDINFDKLQSLVQSYLNSNDLFAMIIDPEGVVIAHPDKSKLREIYNLKRLIKNVLVKDASGESVQNEAGYHQTEEVKLDWDERVSRMIADALNGNSGMAENIRIEGRNSTVYYEPIPLPGQESTGHYSLILIRDNSSTIKTQIAISTFILLFTAFSIFLFIFFFRIQFGRFILKPVRKLAASMKDATVGTHQDILLGTNDEFQLLGDTYNIMRTNLANANEKLAEMNEKLEQIVDERTEELKNLNQKLRKDIAKREEIEVSLRESEGRYRTLVENTLDGYFICQIPSGKFLFLNRRIVKLFGYTMKEALGLTIRDVIVPEAHDDISELIQARLKGKFMRFERQVYQAIRKDGSSFRAEVSTSMVTFQDQTAIQGILRDITDQESLQEQIQKAERMQAIGTLAGGIAHDFNNLLMGIQGRTSLMLMDAEESHQDYEQLKGIEDYVRRAANLTKQLLGFARGGKYQTAAADLNALIQKSVDMFGRTKKEISIHTKFQQNIWPVEVDQSQIDQVLLNLFVNAWQAMPGGGQIYIQTKNCKLDEGFVRPHSLKSGRYVEITVGDTGLGMDPSIRRRIFEPFFTTKEKERGTGLGLASAYGIIKNHDGIITVQSEKGKGSTFTIYLPASDKAVSNIRVLREKKLLGEGTILLIDDEELILEVGKGMLDKLGYNTLIADSGEKAIAIYRENQDKIVLVILDMVMPKMSGRETYDRLKKINPQLKILISSGYSLEGDARDILNGSSDGFIQKPFDVRTMSTKIKQFLP